MSDQSESRTVHVRRANTMYTTTLFSGLPRVLAVQAAAPLAPALEARVDMAWRRAQAAAPGERPFNGSIVSVVRASKDEIDVEITEYRRFLAQHSDRGLAAELRLRPLAVSGLLVCADGAVFGRRSPNNAEAVGQWELAPSGGVDARTLQVGQAINAVDQILVELEEELGVSRRFVERAEMFCMVQAAESGTVDLGIELSTPTLAAGKLLQAHRTCGSKEYSEVVVVPVAELDRFVLTEGHRIVPTSMSLLACRRLGNAAGEHK